MRQNYICKFLILHKMLYIHEYYLNESNSLFLLLIRINSFFFNMVTNEISLYLIAIFCVHIDIFEFYLHYPKELRTKSISNF